jgi:phage I-like protein
MTTPFQILQDDWIQISPLGDHPHQLGIQRIDAASVAAMANRFNSFRARLGRLFSGVPLFEGHHDADSEKYPNGKSYAWVMELADRGADGLWGRLKWTPEGRELVANGNYKFISPFWNALEIARENGRPVFRPDSLLSLALTNLPNLPLPPLANEINSMKKLTEILNLTDDAAPDAICAAAESLANQAATREGEFATLQNSLSTQKSELSTSLANALSRASAAETKLAAMILDNAIRENRITLAQRDHWRAELEKDLAAAEIALANQQPALNTESVTRELGNQKEILANEQSRRAALNDYITQQMANGATYDEAWAKAKMERAEIFANMAKR